MVACIEGWVAKPRSRVQLHVFQSIDRPLHSLNKELGRMISATPVATEYKQ